MGVYIRANSCEQLDREIRVAVNTVKYLLFFLMGCFLFSRRDALSRGDRRDERNGETTFSRKIRILRLVLRFRRRIQFFFPYIYRIYIYIYRYYFEIISKRLFRQRGGRYKKASTLRFNKRFYFIPRDALKVRKVERLRTGGTLAAGHRP